MIALQKLRAIARNASASHFHMLAVLLLWLGLSIWVGHPGIGLLYTLLALLALLLTFPLWAPALALLVNIVSRHRAKP